MQSFVIKAWIDEVAQFIDANRKRKRDDNDEIVYSSPMSSPSERPLTVPVDLDTTPRARLDGQSTRTTSLIEPFRHPDSSPTTKKRRQSPSKKHNTTASLLTLDPPIHVVPTLGLSPIPICIRGLYRELYATTSEFLPLNLKRIMTQDEMDNLIIPPHMWRRQEDETSSDHQRIQNEHHTILDILEEAVEASQLCKGESAWNAQVHYPLLKLAFSQFPFLRPETVTNAQIVEDFLPRSNNIASSSASSSSLLSSNDSSGWTESSSTSAHKMVDFALVLIPDAELQTKIDHFLRTQHHATINQTTYHALANRPVPLFIGTKTTSGSGSRSQVQLGIWAASWFQRLRAAGSAKEALPIPLVRVYGHVWQVMIAIDENDKVLMVDQAVCIGDTASIIGMYQLMAALRIIGKWADTEFRAWITEFLDSV
ncbi:hypothetical protein FPOAC2_07537 [Fusarium poae]|uniref:hypothetical protein n=1 Tax=Fusarium poae TaxID=36050 RepID=UPI001CE85F30|nr:hypothetical protein FPOAC1_007625 [Fusarium poae]KAG8668247.1 hypothetical protein FPOAC1_007625 [Fusarium poae]